MSSKIKQWGSLAGIMFVGALSARATITMTPSNGEVFAVDEQVTLSADCDGSGAMEPTSECKGECEQVGTWEKLSYPVYEYTGEGVTGKDQLDTSSPGKKSGTVTATFTWECPDSGDSEEGEPETDTFSYTVVKVEITPESDLVDDGEDSVQYEAKVTPDGLDVTYKWLRDGAWPSGAGNNPELNYSTETSSKTKIKKTHWFAKSNDYRRKVDNENCEYTIDCEVTIGEKKFKPKNTAKLVVYVHLEGYTYWPYLAGEDTIKIESFQDTTIFGKEVTKWKVVAQGEFRRVQAKIKSIGVSKNSQFYNKLEAHENKHINQWTSEIPWKDLYNADKLYTEKIHGLIAESEQKLREKISKIISSKKESDKKIGINTHCKREEAAFKASDSTAPFFLTTEDDWKKVYKCN